MTFNILIISSEKNANIWPYFRRGFHEKGYKYKSQENI